MVTTIRRELQTILGGVDLTYKWFRLPLEISTFEFATNYQPPRETSDVTSLGFIPISKTSWMHGGGLESTDYTQLPESNESICGVFLPVSPIGKANSFFCACSTATLTGLTERTKTSSCCSPSGQWGRTNMKRTENWSGGVVDYFRVSQAKNWSSASSFGKN
jgi:hypothetical protein